MMAFVSIKGSELKDRGKLRWERCKNQTRETNWNRLKQFILINQASISHNTQITKQISFLPRYTISCKQATRPSFLFCSPTTILWLISSPALFHNFTYSPVVLTLVLAKHPSSFRISRRVWIGVAQQRLQRKTLMV